MDLITQITFRRIECNNECGILIINKAYNITTLILVNGDNIDIENSTQYSRIRI